jgi:hypothetical protein
VVKQLGSNFDVPAEGEERGGEKMQQFNVQWFNKNQLETASEVAPRTEELKKRVAPSGAKPPAAKGQAPARPAPTEEYFQELAGKALPEQPTDQGRARQEGRQMTAGVGLADTQGDAVRRYQEEHRRQLVDTYEDSVGGVAFSPDGRMLAPGLASASRDAEIARGSVAGEGVSAAGGDLVPGGAGGAPTAQAARLPGGLASLDVELPKRGTVYRFTTPKGDVEITARAVSRELTERAVQAAIAAGIFLVVLWFVSLVRRGGFRWMTGRVGSWCLILGGLLLLCLLPALGLLATCGGITAKLRRVADGP